MIRPPSVSEEKCTQDYIIKSTNILLGSRALVVCLAAHGSAALQAKLGGATPGWNTPAPDRFIDMVSISVPRSSNSDASPGADPSGGVVQLVADLGFERQGEHFPCPCLPRISTCSRRCLDLGYQLRASGIVRAALATRQPAGAARSYGHWAGAAEWQAAVYLSDPRYIP